MNGVRKKTILIPGGAGYIGSHTGYLLSQLGYKIIAIDKYVHGQNFCPEWATIIRGDFADPEILKTIFTKYSIDAVMHFAAFIEVGESVKKPRDFYENNVTKVLKLLDTMLEYDVKKIIFSSSCAVYSHPIRVPMDEEHPTEPVSPYGRNKLMVEYALRDYAHAYGLQFVSLRYFNASGSLFEYGLGEQHNPESHIIPLLLRAILHEKTFKLFGTDYDTPDGTCVRDYIHVADIAQAHVLAYNYLEHNNPSDFFNLGTGRGYSVKEVIEMAERVCDKHVVIKEVARRAGDAHVLVADPTKSKKILGWQAKQSDLRSIIQSALAWELRANSAYKSLLAQQPKTF